MVAAISRILRLASLLQEVQQLEAQEQEDRDHLWLPQEVLQLPQLETREEVQPEAHQRLMVEERLRQQAEVHQLPLVEERLHQQAGARRLLVEPQLKGEELLPAEVLWQEASSLTNPQ